jgi:hypothetical protein
MWQGEQGKDNYFDESQEENNDAHFGVGLAGRHYPGVGAGTSLTYSADDTEDYGERAWDMENAKEQDA